MIEKNPAATTTNNGLPNPENHPGSDVVIYDGKCKFCTAGVKRLHRLDGKNRLTFVSLHDERVSSLCPDLTHKELMEQMYVVTGGTPNGKTYGGAAAFRYITCRLPKLWLIAPFMHIPFTLRIWQWLYMQVAKRRYKWGKIDDSCEGGTCNIHFDK